MSAVAIYICHNCRVATMTPTEHSGNHFAVIGPMADRVFEEFKKLHPEHDIKMESDAHGQISAEQYNFDKRGFDWEGWL